MADEAPTTEQNEDAPKKKGGMKTILVTAVLLLLEAVVIGGGFMMLSKPTELAAEPMEDDEVEVAERVVEVQILDENLTNDRLGAVFMYPVELYVQVPEADQAWFEDLVAQYRNQVRADVTALWRTFEPEALQEPRLETVTRRLEALLRERFEGDPGADDSRILRCVIVCGTGFKMGR